MKKIDLIALDLDGTALNPQNQVSPATADAVRRARESGIHVVVSTGRICGEARDFALMLGTDDQMVTSGGATLSSVSQERCTCLLYTSLAPMSSAVSVIICLSSCSTCVEISGARNAAAIASFGLPRMPIALPTSFDQPFGNRVMSYTILGNATCLMHWTYIEYSLLMAI